MPRMVAAQTLSIAANTSTANLLAGKLFEFLDRPANVLLAAAAAAAGINCTFVIGGRVVVQDEPVSQANRFPILPDDAVTQERGMGRMVLTFRNTTGAAVVLSGATVDVDYLR